MKPSEVKYVSFLKLIEFSFRNEFFLSQELGKPAQKMPITERESPNDIRIFYMILMLFPMTLKIHLCPFSLKFSFASNCNN